LLTEPDDYIQLGLVLVMRRRLPNGGVTALWFNAVTGEFEVDARYVLDFHSSRNDPETLTREEFFRRVAIQKQAGNFVVED
jgi:hypothetical protein